MYIQLINDGLGRQLLEPPSGDHLELGLVLGTGRRARAWSVLLMFNLLLLKPVLQIHWDYTQSFSLRLAP